MLFVEVVLPMSLPRVDPLALSGPRLLRRDPRRGTNVLSCSGILRNPFGLHDLRNKKQQEGLHPDQSWAGVQTIRALISQRLGLGR